MDVTPPERGPLCARHQVVGVGERLAQHLVAVPDEAEARVVGVQVGEGHRVDGRRWDPQRPEGAQQRPAPGGTERRGQDVAAQAHVDQQPPAAPLDEHTAGRGGDAPGAGQCLGVVAPVGGGDGG